MIVGIPVYNDLENLKDMISSLVSSTAEYDKIILIVSESNDGTIEFVNTLPKKTFEIVHTPKLGPLDAYNRLFNIAKERKADLFLTQTDVEFPNISKDWLLEMKQISQNPKYGMITCFGGGGVSGPDFIDGFKWVGAWAVYIPYRTINKLGGYDNNIPLGFGVDIDYSYAILKAGLNIYQTNYWVYHKPNYDTAHEHEKVGNIEQIKKDAYNYMRKKWKVGEFAE